MKRLVLLVVMILSIVVALPAVAAEKQRTFFNKEFGFKFQYPASWEVSPTLTSNSRAKVVSPASTPHAECAVIVQRYPQLSSLSQIEIDRLFTEPQPPSELKSALSQGGNNVEIVAVSVGALHSRPAQLARVRYSTGTSSGQAFISGRIVSTATPGLTWTLTCGGQGSSQADAEKNYQSWQLEINRIISSFRFQNRRDK